MATGEESGPPAGASWPEAPEAPETPEAPEAPRGRPVVRPLPFAPGLPFDLAETLKSGQIFQWEPLSIGGVAGFAGCIGDAPPSWIAQCENGGLLTLAGDEARVRRYFGLDQDLAAIHATFPRGDAVLEAALAYCPGLRIARQPPWECLATFITSSLKQVAHIRGISLALRRRYGVGDLLGGQRFHRYPSPARVAALGETALRECGLGYRAVSLARAAERIASGEIDLEALAADGPERIRETLLSLHGVGEKIANCVLLFAYGRWDAFPIDVWIERILRESYRKRVKGAKLQTWAQRHFGPHAGYAQQYLFHYARKSELASPARVRTLSPTL